MSCSFRMNIGGESTDLRMRAPVERLASLGPITAWRGAVVTVAVESILLS